MANRFPLVLDTTDGNKIKEIPAGDNLDLRNVSISDVQNITALGTINAASVQINGEELKAGEFVDLTDVPNSYTGFEGFLLKVKDDGTGIEFTTLGAGGSDFAVNDILLSGDIVPQTLNTSNIGSNEKRLAQVHSQFFQGSLKGFDGSTVFDATSNQIPYAVIAGAPQVVSDLTNDADYITRAELTDGTITVEVSNTGNLIGSVFGEDSSLLVDHINSRINAARLTQNGASDGQTIVWNDATQVWEPGIAGDITGLSSNKVDTLTVEAGYKFTFGDNPGLIEADGIEITTNTDPVSFNGDMELQDGKTFAPATDGQGAIGSVSARFGNGYFDNLDGNSITGTLTGTAEATSIKTDSAVLGDKTAGDGGYDVHVVGDVGFTGGSMNMNGADLIAPNLVNATGDIKGSVFGDDSTPLVDAVNNNLSGNIVTSSITGNIINIAATTKVAINNVELGNELYPDTNNTGKVGTSSLKFAEGNFVAVNSDTISVSSFSTTSITTEDLEVVGTGTGEITSGSDLVFTSGNRSRFEGGPVKLTNANQASIDAIVTQSGDVVYNTTDNRFQFYQNGNWVQLHKGLFEGDVIGSIFADDSAVLFDAVAGKLISPTVSGLATFENNVTIQGNLTVSGTTTSIETTNTNITDNIITLNAGESGAGVTSGSSGIEVDRGSSANKTFTWVEASNYWSLQGEQLALGSLSSTSSGNITDFTNITGASGGTISQFTNITGDTGGTISQFTNITGDSGGTISGFTDITGDSGGTVSGFTNITGDSGGTISQFTNITGDSGGTISQFTNITGDSGGTISQFTNITGDGGGTISAFANLTGDTSGDITQFINITGTGAGTISGFALSGNLTGNVTGNTTGYHTGDVTGSIFADDSSLIVDAINSRLFGALKGDVTGSIFADDSTILIDATNGSISIANLNMVGETGNTPVDTGTVDSWLEVSVNGNTKYIPLYA